MFNIVSVALFSLLICLSCSLQTISPMTGRLPAVNKISSYTFPARPLGKLVDEGFSGLHFDHKTSNGDLIFWTHSDRGPMPEAFKDSKTGHLARTIWYPDFNPHISKFKLRKDTNTIEYLETVILALPDGKKMSGLPNFLPTNTRTGDELPLTADGVPLKLDLMGIDPEGMCKVNDGFWLVEEYGPSLLKFNLKGELLHRFVPKGYYTSAQLSYFKKVYGPGVINDVLPAKLMLRKFNRGFESIACGPDKIYAALQSPITAGIRNVIMIELDIKLIKITKVLNYPLDNARNKVNDMAYHNGNIFILEGNGNIGPLANMQIFSAHIVRNKISKVMVLDLVKEGIEFPEKIEGLTIVNNGTLAIVNDNDFGSTNSLQMDSTKKSLLTLLHK